MGVQVPIKRTRGVGEDGEHVVEPTLAPGLVPSPETRVVVHQGTIHVYVPVDIGLSEKPGSGRCCSCSLPNIDLFGVAGVESFAQCLFCVWEFKVGLECMQLVVLLFALLNGKDYTAEYDQTPVALRYWLG